MPAHEPTIPSTRSTRAPAHIAAGDGQQFVLHFQDGDRQVTDANHILLAVRYLSSVLGDEARAGSAESLAKVLEHCSAWVQRHHTQISRATLSPHSVSTRACLKLLFLVEQREIVYDEALDDRLIELDLAVNEDPAVTGVSLAVLLIPPTDDAGRATFLSSSLPSMGLVMPEHAAGA